MQRVRKRHNHCNLQHEVHLYIILHQGFQTRVRKGAAGGL